jgi:hypothetical protein
VLWLKIGCVGPTCQTSQPCNLAGQPSSLLAPPLGITLRTAFAGYVDKIVFRNAPTHGRLTKVMWLTGHTLARLSRCFVPRHSLVSYCL